MDKIASLTDESTNPFIDESICEGVWMIGATIVAQFNNLEEAQREYDALPEQVEIAIGEKKLHVFKRDICVDFLIDE